MALRAAFHVPDVEAMALPSNTRNLERLLLRKPPLYQRQRPTPEDPRPKDSDSSAAREPNAEEPHPKGGGGSAAREKSVCQRTPKTRWRRVESTKPANEGRAST